MRTPQLLAIAITALALSACGDDDDDGVQPIPYEDDGKLQVMTRNLYLGAELDAVIAAQTPTEFVNATTAVWNAVQTNDFGARAEALADEILAELPDVVGLQEVSLWRTQSPGDAAAGNFTPNATTVAIDYLQILLDALSARGLSYVPAQTLELFDVEVPIASGQDVRLTDRQVILVREGVPHTATASDREAFPEAALLPLELLGGAAEVLVRRGWTKVEVTVGSGTAVEDVTIYNTHLEAFADPPRDAQASLLAGIIAADDAARIVLLGDLNSTDAEAAYGTFADAGFADAWATLGTGDGFTCCFAPDLREPRATRDLDERIDHVLWTGDLALEAVELVGEEDADRRSSLWPSDHAGVTATFGFAG